MVLDKLKRFRGLIPCFSCLSLALGEILFSFLLFPDYYPAIHDRIAAEHLAAGIAINAFFCISLPIGLLYITTRENQRS
jgi:hypothetical protein